MTSIYEEIQIAIHGIWSRRWVALGIAWTVALLGWLVVALIPNSYQSKARIFVEPQAMLTPKSGANPLERQQELEQVRQTLTSVDNLAQVVRGTDLARSVQSDRDIGARVATLKTSITVVSLQDNLFEISAKSADSSISDRANAQLAGQIVAKLIDLLAQENMTGSQAETSKTIRILDGQIAARAKDLQIAEQRRVGFEQRNVGMLPGAGSISQRMDSVRNELGQVDSQLVAAQSALAAINGQLAATPPSLDTGDAGGQGGSALGAAMGELAAARSRGWTDNHPDVVAIKRQIAAIRAMGGAGSGVTRTPNPAYIQLRSVQAERAASASALQARKGELAANLAGMSARQVQEPGIAAEQDRLDRDYNAVKVQYDKLIADREDAKLRGEVQSQAGSFTFRIIDPPFVPTAPASPNRPLLLVGVLVVAIGAGAGGTFALSQIRTTFATANRLERSTGLPVMGSITETLGAGAQQARRQKLRLFAGASAGLALMCAALVILEFVQRGLSA